MSDQKKQDWLQARSKGIGGSEITALMGLDPYRTPYALWEIKTGRVGDFSGNKFTDAGNYLEPVVAQMFSDQTGMEAYIKKQEHYAHPEYPHLIGTPDRFVRLTEGGDGVLEIKTTQRRIIREDVTEGAKINWFFQIQWYLGITGFKTGFIAWLCAGVDFDFVQVDFQPDIFADMVEAANEFWAVNVLQDVPPAPISREDIQKIFGMVVPDPVELPEEALHYHQKIKENAARINELETANEELKTAVQLLMLDKSVAIYQGATLFTWKHAEMTRIDTKLLKEREPELWARYAKTSTVRTFLVK
jgi:putative phage-type endonuclease